MTGLQIAAALPHGEIVEVFSDLYLVTGTATLPSPPMMRFSRNMVVVRNGGSLTLVNSMRLDEDGLHRLEALGAVENVVRLAGFHGRDDAFYKRRYDATVYAPRGQVYRRGFELDGDPYFEADVALDPGSELPIPGARLHLIGGAEPPEAVLLLLRHHGGVLISGDALQNWATPDRYFSLLARVAMRLMGFIKPHNVGPAWRKATTPSRAGLLGLLELPFDHVLPAHGTPVIGNARQLYRPALENAAAQAGG